MFRAWIARFGWNVMGTDLSWPMLCAAVHLAYEHGLDDRLHAVRAPMERIPARDRSFDLVIAHGIWNLAGSATQFRRAVAGRLGWPTLSTGKATVIYEAKFRRQAWLALRPTWSLRATRSDCRQGP
jgi:methyltransferase family protein